MNAVNQGNKGKRGNGVGGIAKSGRIPSFPDSYHVWKLLKDKCSLRSVLYKLNTIFLCEEFLWRIKEI